MQDTADGQADEVERALRDATLDFEAAQASGDQAMIETTKRAMGEAFGNLVQSKLPPRSVSQAGPEET